MSYTRKEAISCLKELTKELGHSPSQNEFESITGNSWWDIGKHFGGWNKAKNEAGIEQYQGGHDDVYTKEEIIESIQEYVEQEGRVPSSTAFDDVEHTPSVDVIQNKFKSWNEAIVASGYKPNKETYNHNSTYFSQINTPEKSYWLGLLIGDGSVTTKNRKNEIRLTLKEKNHVENFRDIVSPEAPIYKDRSVYCCRISDKLMASDLEDYGMKNKIIPDLEYKNEFTRGLFDADGTATRDLALYSENKESVNKIASWIPTENYTVYSHKRDGRKAEHQLRIHETDISDVINWMYPNGRKTSPSLARKKNRLLNKI